MKFESLTGSQRSRRNKVSQQAPAAVESLEVRSLMTVISPTGTVFDATPTILWEAVDNATSYDLWVSDREQVKTEFIKQNIATTHFTPTTPLNLGKTRAWVRANFADGTSTDWSAPTDFIVLAKPSLTGPVNSQLPSAPYKLNETKPTITWETAPGASRFEIFLSDQTNLTGQVFTVANLTPVLNSEGYAFFDENHEIVREEKTSFELPNDLQMGSYRVFIRARDDGGRWSDWSAPLNFEVAPQVTITRPTAPSFENPPLLEWQAVPDATSYDVFVAKAATPTKALYNIKMQTATSYQIPKTLADGSYVFWVRAHRSVTGRPDVAGIWSAPATFSTIQNPEITGPVGISTNVAGQRLITDTRPTIEWTPIDRAARYDVWVHRANTNPTYLVTTSSTNSYTFEKDIKAGDYTVWVRAISTTGKMTSWSAPYTFTATGGVAIITSPTAGENVIPIPDITWTAVPDAKTYNIQIAWLGVDFTYIQTVGISITTFAPTDPLPTGSYRVWVQAVKADGTTLPWSAPVDFSVASNEGELPAGEIPELLAVLLPTRAETQDNTGTDSQAAQPVEISAPDAHPDHDLADARAVVIPPTHETVLPDVPFLDGVLEQLAEVDGAAEWWMPQSSES